MVAAPESIAAQTQAQQSGPNNNTQQNNVVRSGNVTPASLKSSLNGAGSDLVGQVANGLNGHSEQSYPSKEETVDDFTAADKSNSRPALNSNHHSNFDPTTPQAPTNLPPPEIARQIPCRFFPLGTCKYGNSCAFSHNGSSASIVPPSSQGAPAPAAPQQQQQPQQNGAASPEDYAPQHHDPNMMFYPPQMDQQYFDPSQYPLQQPQYFGYPQFQYYGNQQPFYPPPPPPAMSQQQPSSSMLSPEQSTSAAPSSDDLPAPPSIQPIQTFSSPPAPQSAYLPYPFPLQPQQMGEFNHNFAPPAQQSQQPIVPSSPASLHTFFQTGAPTSATSPPSASTPASALPSSLAPPPPPPFVKGAPAPLLNARPASNGVAGPLRRSVPPSGMIPNGGPYPYNPHLSKSSSIMPGQNGVRRFDGQPPRPGGPKPPCSFFEANRCKNGDTCFFVHLLPDGTDARALKQGLIGRDGRTDNPEATGGFPLAWANGKNPKLFKLGGANPGYQGKYPRQNRYEEDHRLSMQASTRAGGPVEGVEEAVEGLVQQPQTQQNFAPRPHVPGFHHQNQNQHFQQQRPPVPSVPSSSIPGADAPTLVAAINRLTKSRAPAVASTSPSQTSSATTPSAPNHGQRVPSNDDFPALPAGPLSPPLEKTSASSSMQSSFELPSQVSDVESSSSTVIEESKAEAVVAAAPASVEAVAEEPSSAMDKSMSEASDSDFVIVTHSDANIPSSEATASTPAPASVAASTPAPAVAAPAPAPAPALPRPLSFASAAARGAQVPTPEKPKKVVAPVAPKAANADEKDGGKKEKKGKGGKGSNGGERREPRAQQVQQANLPVAIKA